MELREMKTKRGQFARIIMVSENNFALELYANGEYGKPASCYKSKFTSEQDAVSYFESERDFIHS